MVIFTVISMSHEQAGISRWVPLPHTEQEGTSWTPRGRMQPRHQQDQRVVTVSGVGQHRARAGQGRDKTPQLFLLLLQ